MAEQETGASSAHQGLIDDERKAWVDARFEPPSSMAARVWEQLSPLGFTEMELLCFNLEHAGRVALALDPDLVIHLKRALAWLYIAHYNHPEVFHGLHEVQGERGEVHSVSPPASPSTTQGGEHRVGGGES